MASDSTGNDAAETKAAGMMTDPFLLRAYERIRDEPNNAEADALLAEIQRRGLDA